jgi:hypothetical protein
MVKRSRRSRYRTDEEMRSQQLERRDGRKEEGDPQSYLGFHDTVSHRLVF